MGGRHTYIWTAQGWCYLAVLLDLFSRRVVGWAFAKHMRRELPMKALQRALDGAGDCYDNAVAESFFASLKKECVSRTHFATRTEAFDAIQAYVDGFYNPVRCHSALGYLSPIDFESVHRVGQTAA